MSLLFDPAAWASLLTLTSLEIILGVDNIVVLSLLTNRLPAQDARRARSWGLLLALVLRLVLLSFISAIIRLTTPVLTAGGLTFSWRDLIMIAGGLFLIFKATEQIHGLIEARDKDPSRRPPAKARFAAVITQIALMDLVFSIDSIVTAVGLAQHIEVMAAAICIAIGIMYFAANVTANFIERHPALKMLALAFLILIGVVLVADGFGAHLPRAYIYFAMGFAALVEALNIWAGSATNASQTGQGRLPGQSLETGPVPRGHPAVASEPGATRSLLRAARMKALRRRSRRK